MEVPAKPIAADGDLQRPTPIVRPEKARAMKGQSAFRKPAAAKPLEGDEALAEGPKKASKEDGAAGDDADECPAEDAGEPEQHDNNVLGILKRLPEGANPTGGLEVGRKSRAIGSSPTSALPTGTRPFHISIAAECNLDIAESMAAFKGIVDDGDINKTVALQLAIGEDVERSFDFLMFLACH